MTIKIKNIAAVILFTISASIAFTSCKKDNNKAVTPPAKVDTATIIVNGNYDNPAKGPAAFGTKYVNISTGAQDSVGTVSYNLLFTSNNNANIAPASGFTLKYLITTTALASITTTDYDNASAQTITTFGMNTSATATPNGWWNYNTTTHAISPVPNIVFFLSDGTHIYAFQCTSILGQGSATSNRGVYYFLRSNIK